MKQVFIGLFLVYSWLFVYSQDVNNDDANFGNNSNYKTEIIDGKMFILHNVESKQTLYSISKLYGIQISDIIKTNPDAQMGIRIGEVLRIPINENVAINNSKLESKEDIGFSYHIVKQNETLASIAEIYGVTVNDINLINNGLVQPLKLGILIKIPLSTFGLVDESKNGKIGKSDKNVNMEPAVNVNPDISTADKHIVAHGETAYGIAKLHNISLESLYQLNPTARSGVNTGQILILPVGSSDNNNVERKKIENIYGNCYKNNDSLILFYPRSVISSGHIINVALFIPLYLNNVQGQVSSLVSGAVKNPHSLEGLKYIGIYEGALIALDQLAENGFNVRLTLYDANRNLSEISEMLKNPELLKTDIIFCYTYFEGFKIINAFARTNKIPIINGLSERSEVVSGNEIVFKTVPDNSYQAVSLANYITSELPESDILIVRQKNDAALKIASRLSNELAYLGHKSYMKKIVISDSLGSAVSDFLISATKVSAAPQIKPRHVIILIGTDKVFIMNSMRILSKMKNKSFTIVGLPAWPNDNVNMLTETDISYIKNMDIRFVSESAIDKSDPVNYEFEADFKNEFGFFPDEYAYQSYDLMMFFIAGMEKFKDSFYRQIPYLHYDGIRSGYRFIDVNAGGFENIFWNIYGYDNFRIKRLNKN